MIKENVQKQKAEMKIAVIGSRGFTHYRLLVTTLDEIPNKKMIVSGGAKGADQMAEQYAREHDIETKIFLPEYAKFGRGAPIKRNELIVKEADLVIAFWDGKSRGTKNAIDTAKALGKEVMIVQW
jgi:predicted Rossmann fold nucleotide-binding protein DprA/Smf involved in DNA uptake